MSHTVFYRKYRPSNFSELVGQEAVATTLLQALREGTVSHAYLLCGPRGTGKTTIARLLAKGVNCLNLNNGEPCNSCANCLAIKDNAFPDIIEIDAASNRSIDDIRDLKERVHFMPLQGQKKVYIIDEVHMLTKEAFNALLKTLEEPPAHVHFILATTERHKVPATIVSRAQNFTLKPLPEEKIIGLLNKVTQEENVETDPEAIKIIAQASEGGARDALTLLEQCVLDKKVSIEYVINQLGFVRTAVVEQFVTTWQEGSAEEKLVYLKELEEQGILVDQFVKQATLYLRDCLHKSIQHNDNKKTWFIKAIEAMLTCEKQLALTPLPILALELAYFSLDSMNSHTTTITTLPPSPPSNPSPLSTTTSPNSPPPPSSSAPTFANTVQSELTQSSPSLPNSEFRTQNSPDHSLQTQWQKNVKTLPPTLRLALMGSEIVREGNKAFIYVNSQFELTKASTNAGIVNIRELVAQQLQENLDVELKVKEDQPQAPEVITKVQAIFGTQTAA